MANQNLSGLSAVFGSPEAVSLAGNVGGAVLGQYMADKQMDKQFANQSKLQRQAFKLNQDAVKQQAQLEVIGLRNAGLNPAGANGSGAPSVQPGSASVGNVPTLGNIFEGVAQIVAAAKAPSEVGKLNAETQNTETQTAGEKQRQDFVVPLALEKGSKEIGLLTENIRNAKNINDAWQAGDKFLREHSQMIFERMLGQLEKDGYYDSLSADTRNTLESLAHGDMTIGQGEYDSLIKQIDAQVKLSDGDRRIVDNAFANNVTSRQWHDEDVMTAITKAPHDLRVKMYKEVDHLNAEISGIMQDIETGKAEEALKKAQKLATDFTRESAELNDVKWLIKHGRYDDADVRTTEQSLENFQRLTEQLAKTVEMMAMAKLAGESAKPSLTPQKPSVVPPSEKQLIEVNSPKDLRRYMNFR